jgi:hypothetical protein
MWTTEGKVGGTLNPFNAPTHDAYFVNQRSDDLHLTNRQLTHCLFIDIGFKGATIRNVDFSHSTFVRCYFRGARLRDVNFTGCRFVQCDFPSARLVTCDLSYSKWDDTEIDEEEVLSNLPERPNPIITLRWWSSCSRRRLSFDLARRPRTEAH